MRWWAKWAKVNSGMENVTEIIHEEKDADIASKKGEEEFGGEIGEGKLQSPDEVMMDVILQDVTVSHLQLKQKPLTTFIGGGDFSISDHRFACECKCLFLSLPHPCDTHTQSLGKTTPKDLRVCVTGVCPALKYCFGKHHPFKVTAIMPFASVWSSDSSCISGNNNCSRLYMCRIYDTYTTLVCKSVELYSQMTPAETESWRHSVYFLGTKVQILTLHT